MNKKIFVYGTLMEDFCNYKKYLIGKAEKKGCGRAKGKLYHLKDKGYPAMIKGNDYVYGEIFEIKDWENTVKSLDFLENYFGEENPENEYNRTLVEVEIGYTEVKEKIFAYMYNCKTEKELMKEIYIPKGSWRAFMENRIS